jgi:hypothetical protein
MIMAITILHFEQVYMKKFEQSWARMNLLYRISWG